MVPVQLRNGTELRLIASVNALCDFEAELARAGFDPEREFKRIAAGVGGTLSGIRALVWACAKDQHPGVGQRRLDPADTAGRWVSGAIGNLVASLPRW